MISRTKTLVLLVFLILCSDIGKAQQTSEVPWMEGSWGVRLIIRGGKDLDRYVANGYDYVEAAKQIVRDYPTIGHVITNLTNNANSSLYTVRQNNYIDVANEIHPDFVPSLENEQIIFDVIKVFKDAGIKVILYINHWPNMGEGSAAQIAGWDAYKNRNNLGNYPAFNLLMRGFLERFDGLVDGYWIDKIGGSDDSIPRKDIFINVIKETNPGAALGVNFNKSYFPGIKVDSDGVDERDEDDYKIIKYQANDIWSQFTAGHVTSIGGQKAPSNSWGYEEYTVTDMEESPLSVHPETGKVFVKHMFAPIRRRWSLNDEPLMYDKDQAYRMVKRITSAGASITFSTTITNGGLAMPDEVEVLKHVNDQLEANTDYVPYTRPQQAYLVGETKPNYHQFIDFREIPNKKVGDPDFSPFAHASSGAAVTLSSSNTNVATIVNNKIRIKGVGTTNITASQGGNNTFAAAASKMRQLTITTDDGGTDPDETNLALQGAATQSSNHPNGGGEAFLAIDGNTNGKWSGGSVTRTSSEIDPWWQVDLGSNHTINNINVFARVDNCCNTRLSNFDVIVMDDNGAITYTKTYTTYPDPSIAMDVGGVTGQIIKIQQHSDPKSIVLNLAEVEVYGSEIIPPTDSSNLALDGVASQSSTVFEGEASRAIDGNTNGAYSGGSVTHTDNDATPYWQVQLDAGYPIGDITIFGRTDACCLERLSNFTVMLFNEGTRTFLKTFQSYPDPSITVNAGGAIGNLIRIRSNTSQGLSLAEVQVFEDIECASFSTIQAQNYNSMSGLVIESTTDSSGNKHLGYINNGDWSKYESVDLTCTTSIEARVSSKTSGGNIEVRLGSISGQLIGTINVPSTKSWSSWVTVSANIDAVNDINDLYLVYKGSNGYLFNVNWIRFSNDQVKTPPTSIGDQSQLFIYPNPVADQVNISLDTNETSTYTISDMNGKTILKGVINEGSVSLDMNGLSKGLYLIKIYNGSHVLTDKIIKE